MGLAFSKRLLRLWVPGEPVLIRLSPCLFLCFRHAKEACCARTTPSNTPDLPSRMTCHDAIHFSCWRRRPGHRLVISRSPLKGTDRT